MTEFVVALGLLTMIGIYLAVTFGRTQQEGVSSQIVQNANNKIVADPS